MFTVKRSDDGEDVELYEDETARAAANLMRTFCMLRQQAEKENDEHFLSQADFIAPKGYKDHMGMFAVSCFGCDALVAKYEAENDNYNKIMCQALADRFVETFAEYLHRDIRMNSWGYARDEGLDESDLLKIKYDGIRPAPGYLSQPDHTEKTTMCYVGSNLSKGASWNRTKLFAQYDANDGVAAYLSVGTQRMTMTYWCRQLPF